MHGAEKACTVVLYLAQTKTGGDGKFLLTNGSFHDIINLALSGTDGGIAQLARAFGSYPECHWFKSSCRYQKAEGSSAFFFGPVVKRLRHRPFTAVTRVRFSSGSPEKSTLRRAFFNEINPFGFVKCRCAA